MASQIIQEILTTATINQIADLNEIKTEAGEDVNSVPQLSTNFQNAAAAANQAYNAAVAIAQDEETAEQAIIDYQDDSEKTALSNLKKADEAFVAAVNNLTALESGIQAAQNLVNDFNAKTNLASLQQAVTDAKLAYNTLENNAKSVSIYAQKVDVNGKAVVGSSPIIVKNINDLLTKTGLTPSQQAIVLDQLRTAVPRVVVSGSGSGSGGNPPANAKIKWSVTISGPPLKITITLSF
jgi:hypothetical protein